jgi:hypothetical protein
MNIEWYGMCRKMVGKWRSDKIRELRHQVAAMSFSERERERERERELSSSKWGYLFTSISELIEKDCLAKSCQLRIAAATSPDQLYFLFQAVKQEQLPYHSLSDGTSSNQRRRPDNINKLGGRGSDHTHHSSPPLLLF